MKVKIGAIWAGTVKCSYKKTLNLQEKRFQGLWVRLVKIGFNFHGVISRNIDFTSERIQIEAKKVVKTSAIALNLIIRCYFLGL